MKFAFAESISSCPAVVLRSGVGRCAGHESAARRRSRFRCTDVRLLDGPFRDAMLRDQKYLLSLDPDRLLRNFRLNVSCRRTRNRYGGWEVADHRIARPQRSAIIFPRCR